MAQWTKDTVEELLLAKMRNASARMKAKRQPVGMDTLAADLAPFVIALMSDSRRRELGRLIKADVPGSQGLAIINKRRVELKAMSEALFRFAEQEQSSKKYR